MNVMLRESHASASSSRSFSTARDFPFRYIHQKMEICRCVCSKGDYWHGAKKINLPHLKTLLFMSHILQQNHWSSKKLLRAKSGSEQNKQQTTLAILREKATLMGSRHCWCLTGSFGLSLVPLFMKLLSKIPEQTGLVLHELDDRK